MDQMEDTDEYESDEGSPTVSKRQPSLQGGPLSPAPPSDYGSTPRGSKGSWLDKVFRSAGKCPTCHGTGNIPRGECPCLLVCSEV